MGKHPTLVKDYGKSKTYFKDTGYATWTPSNTTTEIVPMETLERYLTPDWNNHDYVATMKFLTHYYLLFRNN